MAHVTREGNIVRVVDPDVDVDVFRGNLLPLPIIPNTVYALLWVRYAQTGNSIWGAWLSHNTAKVGNIFTPPTATERIQRAGQNQNDFALYNDERQIRMHAELDLRGWVVAGPQAVICHSATSTGGYTFHCELAFEPVQVSSQEYAALRRSTTYNLSLDSSPDDYERQDYGARITGPSR